MGEKIYNIFENFINENFIMSNSWNITIASLNNLVDFIVFANSIWPDNLKALILRKILQTCAIATCYRIQNKLRLAEKCVSTVKIKDITRIIEEVAEEIQLLKGWKKATKLVKSNEN